MKDASAKPEQQEPAGGDLSRQAEVLERIGHLTRSLHDNLRELGINEKLEKAVRDIPHAYDRLSYIARMTEQAAVRVLNATEGALPLQETMAEKSRALEADWQQLLESPFSQTRYQVAAERTLEFLQQTHHGAVETKRHLMDIMMAQDFQDLTGQVIIKVTEVAQNIEKHLVQLLVDFSPSELTKDIDSSLLNGPQVNPTANSEALANQEQVDELLKNLGF